MMFHKLYYKLEEAAQKLGVDVDVLHHEAMKGIVKYHKPIQRYDNIVKMTSDDNLLSQHHQEFENRYEETGFPTMFDLLNDGVYEFLDHYDLTVELSREQIQLIYLEGKADVSDLKENVFFARSMDVRCGDDKAELYSASTQVTMNDLVITHSELTRLLALKAEHDNKPTTEQLQQQLDEADARIDELEAAQKNDTKQPIQQQREQALLFWVEGVGHDAVKAMTKSQIHDALKRIDPIFQFSDFDKFWQKQQVIKLGGGKPTR